MEDAMSRGAREANEASDRRAPAVAIEQQTRELKKITENDLRDRLAMAALPQALKFYCDPLGGLPEESFSKSTDLAYTIADHMLIAREETKS